MSDYSGSLILGNVNLVKLRNLNLIYRYVYLLINLLALVAFDLVKNFKLLPFL